MFLKAQQNDSKEPRVRPPQQRYQIRSWFTTLVQKEFLNLISLSVFKNTQFADSIASKISQDEKQNSTFLKLALCYKTRMSKMVATHLRLSSQRQWACMDWTDICRGWYPYSQITQSSRKVPPNFSGHCSEFLQWSSLLELIHASPPPPRLSTS